MRRQLPDPAEARQRPFHSCFEVLAWLAVEFPESVHRFRGPLVQVGKVRGLVEAGHDQGALPLADALGVEPQVLERLALRRIG